MGEVDFQEEAGSVPPPTPPSAPYPYDRPTSPLGDIENEHNTEDRAPENQGTLNGSSNEGILVESNKSLSIIEYDSWDHMKRVTSKILAAEKSRADSLEDRLKTMERENLRLLGIKPADLPKPSKRLSQKKS